MKKENTIIVALAVLAAIIAATWLILVAPSLTGNEVNMTRGVTQQSVDHFDLHMIVLWICVVIGIAVFTVMFTSIVLHRKSRGHKAAKFSHSTKAEIIWTIIPGADPGRDGGSGNDRTGENGRFIRCRNDN